MRIFFGQSFLSPHFPLICFLKVSMQIFMTWFIHLKNTEVLLGPGAKATSWRGPICCSSGDSSMVGVHGHVNKYLRSNMMKAVTDKWTKHHGNAEGESFILSSQEIWVSFPGRYPRRGWVGSNLGCWGKRTAHCIWGCVSGGLWWGRAAVVGGRAGKVSWGRTRRPSKILQARICGGERLNRACI